MPGIKTRIDPTLEQQLFGALVLASDHLDYTGYGDTWEREGAEAQKLPEIIAAAIKRGQEAGLGGHKKNVK